MSTEDRRQILPTPSDFGSYYVEKALGHGGMGDVYLATDTMLDRQVALKVMLKGNEEFVEYRNRDFYKYIMCVNRGVWKRDSLARTAKSISR